MAAVAGVIAETVGRELLRQGHAEVIVENGGDIFLARTQPSVVAVQAGASRLSGRLGISLQPEQMPCGLCCSSGTVGHSLSFGRADAAAVLAASAAVPMPLPPVLAMRSKARQPQRQPGGGAGQRY